MINLELWTRHSRMSDPVDHAAILTGLPPSIGALNDTIQGVLIHSDWLTAYGLDETLPDADSRITLPVAWRLARIFERDARTLGVKRPPARRSIGTCRDFALLLCSILRGNGVPSRLRCGFADYLGEGWQDHWVCEYWDRQAQKWRLSDAQLDEVLKARLGITFDPADVPRRSFMTAAEVWIDCRAGKRDPNQFGHGETTGLWFVKVNVLRDHYVLNNRETSTWDMWRAAPEATRTVHDSSLLDDIAAYPQQPLVEINPDWLAPTASPASRSASG